MEINFTRINNEFIQYTEVDGKKYYCLLDIFKILQLIPSMGVTKSKPLHIDCDIIYHQMMIGNSFIFTAFVDEDSLKKLNDNQDIFKDLV